MLTHLVPILTEPFFLRAAAAALILATVGGIMGAYIQMRGMSFYTDTIAHSSFTGVALGVLLGLDVGVTAVLFAILMGILVLIIRRRTTLAFDTILGVLFASVASLGIFLLTFLHNVRIDLLGLLFGDILSLSTLDVWTIALAGIISLLVLWSLHEQLILEIVHPDLARVEGVPVARNEVIFGVVVAVMIALGIKLIGIILLSGLFLIPSATSYLLAKTMRELLWGSVLVGMLAVIIGLLGSVIIDTATGPTIVLAASGLFLLTMLVRPLIHD
ncbi:metal ABC transporter permease [Candidatus Berkelbacteria bacterium]|nr:metal ABC transporter permease [Candidatus Berkelbacteria bacterium]